ncbi:PREDICTED: uncharacterized protein LOC106325779 [Brassica oleracea var. oleracea]|uniref:uncharacterized protein LOC106325779 n=1 Tax=Brassica oleracea var. oleracea TaxID=109376 RepID=UPI0006A71815|nr:PREDICTED: uncharacterized protein LOC106325779 [Brassica oleracea var. oleracea]
MPEELAKVIDAAIGTRHRNLQGRRLLEDGGGKRVLLRYNSVGINSITKRKEEEEEKEEKKEDEEEEKEKEKEEEDAAGDGHLWWPGSVDLDMYFYIYIIHVYSHK